MLNPLCKAKSLMNAGGVGYSEITKYVLPETVVTSDTYTTQFGMNGCFILPMFVMEKDKNYTVIVDGLAIGHLANAFDPQMIGNSYLTNGEGIDNGKPWLVVSYESMNLCAVSFLDPTENEKPHTVAVYEEIIYPINEKYIPTVDRIIFKGKDGNRYELHVDISGQLVTSSL